MLVSRKNGLIIIIILGVCMCVICKINTKVASILRKHWFLNAIEKSFGYQKILATIYICQLYDFELFL